MLSDQAFASLICRVQAGDPDAATELLQHFEPEIRLEVRVRLRVQDGRVRRAFDSMDVIQSVLASFFAGVASGRVTPESPQQLLAFLVAMTRNKLLNQVRRQKQQRRDVRRVQTFDAGLHDVAAVEETPSEFIAGKELLREFGRRLTNDEQQLAERRRLGKSWADVAAELGGSPDGHRKRLERAFDRVARELGIDSSA